MFRQVKEVLGVEDGILQYALCADEEFTRHLLVSDRPLTGAEITRITRGMGVANSAARPRVKAFYDACCEKTVSFSEYYSKVRNSPYFFYAWADMDEGKLAAVQAKCGDSIYDNLAQYEAEFGEEFKKAHESILAEAHGQ